MASLIICKFLILIILVNVTVVAGWYIFCKNEKKKKIQKIKSHFNQVNALLVGGLGIEVDTTFCRKKFSEKIIITFREI